MQMKTNLEQKYKVDYRDNCSFKVTPWYTQMIHMLVMSFLTYNLHIKLFYTASSYLSIIVSIFMWEECHPVIFGCCLQALNYNIRCTWITHWCSRANQHTCHTGIYSIKQYVNTTIILMARIGKESNKCRRQLCRYVGMWTVQHYIG